MEKYDDQIQSRIVSVTCEEWEQQLQLAVNFDPNHLNDFHRIIENQKGQIAFQSEDNQMLKAYYEEMNETALVLYEKLKQVQENWQLMVQESDKDSSIIKCFQ